MPVLLILVDSNLLFIILVEISTLVLLLSTNLFILFHVFVNLFALLAQLMVGQTSYYYS
jgi:hypothetical protein